MYNNQPQLGEGSLVSKCIITRQDTQRAVTFQTSNIWLVSRGDMKVTLTLPAREMQMTNKCR